MNEPHSTVAGLLARVGSAGRENLVPAMVGREPRPYHAEPESAVWFRFLREALEQASRERLRVVEGKFQRLADELKALATSLEALREAIRPGPPPDEGTDPDEPGSGSAT